MKDVLVLGSGPAGYYASILCATNGLDVVLVEKEKLGGTGFANGALPIKILLDGIKQNPHITYEHLRKEYTRKMTYCQEKIMSDLKQAKVNLVIGETGFKDKNTISVNGKDISAKNIIIATGSRPSDGFGVVYGKMS